MGRGIFGIDFGSTAFVINKNKISDYYGCYFRLHERTFQYIDPDDIAKLYLMSKGDKTVKYDFSTYDTKNESLEQEELSGKSLQLYYEAKQENFSKIPGMPVAYWVSENFVRAFENEKLGNIANPKVGLQTGCNDEFTRLWFETPIMNICFNATNRQEALETKVRWFPYNKGGDFRKWYGNNDVVVNWENDGFEIRNFKDEKGKLRSRPQNVDCYFKQSITWSKISSGSIAFRYKPKGHIFDVAGTSVFASDNQLFYLEGFCNSKVTLAIVNAISPTLNYEVGHIASLPIIFDDKQKDVVDELVKENISLSKNDWDSFETSWDFEGHPLV